MKYQPDPQPANSRHQSMELLLNRPKPAPEHGEAQSSAGYAAGSVDAASSRVPSEGVGVANHLAILTLSLLMGAFLFLLTRAGSM